MLTKARATQKLATTDYARPVLADATIYRGAMVSASGAGFAPAADTLGDVVGVAKETADNTGGATGDKKVLVEKGIYLFDNKSDDPVPVTAVGDDCYATDDHTVAATQTGTLPIAGRVFAVEANGVWVETY